MEEVIDRGEGDIRFMSSREVKRGIMSREGDKVGEYRE